MQPCRPGCDGAEREGEESAVCRFEMVSSGIPCRIACAGFVVDKYRSFPLSVKFSALRLNNYRPYLIGGVYGAMDLGRKKGMPVLLKAADFGLEFGIGCDIYLPFFKLCPELKFSFGLVDLLQKDRSDLTDKDLIKYPNALSKATSRMVSLTFNFE